ncbi:MAG: cysteine desulfurase family protein [Candidatus Paceibacterota bacterium]|jgi:cysteine desulfurase
MAGKKNSKKISRIYWDTAAGTPVDKRVFEAMKPFLGAPREALLARRSFSGVGAKGGNANSIHKEGVEASRAVEEARAKIAKVLFAHADEIIFTGSGTESDNLAILGTAEAIGVRSTTSGALEVGLLTTKHGHIITTEIEHKAVLEPCRHLQKKGFKVTYLKVDKNGQINLKELRESLTKDTFLVSIMMANNEIGAIQPIKEVAKILRHFKNENHLNLHTGQASRPYLHVDACQAPRFLDLNVEKLGVDLLSFNGSKIYGPKGVGALYVRRGVMLAPIIMGGGQERGLRSGTLNVAGIVGLARALEICQVERELEVKKLSKLQSRLMTELKKISNLVINGPDMASGSAVRKTTSLHEVAFLTSSPLTFSRLPNNINFSIKNFEGEQLVIELDAKGFAVSSGSACSHDSGEGSYAIRAIGGDEARATGAVRISFGREASATEVGRFAKALKEIIKKYQGLA